MEDLQPVPVLADHREQNSPLMARLTSDQRFDLHMATLTSGDYLLDETILIERKTLPDLVASIRDGRLFSQASRLASADYPQLAMLAEGVGRDLDGSGMRREAVQGAIINLSMFFGLPVLRSRSEDETLWIFRCLFRQHRRLLSHALPRKGRRPRAKRAMQYHVLQGLPGVGPGRARALLDYLGSVEAVFTAGEKALVQVPGIGRDTARNIRRVLQ